MGPAAMRSPVMEPDGAAKRRVRRRVMEEQEKRMKAAVRLDRFLANAGAGTRSEVKKSIQKGQVQVNGVLAKKPEQKVDPEKDVVSVNGKEYRAAPEFVYYLLHKPAGYVSARTDGREKTVLELVPADRRRILSPVGRLDKDTEGLLLITDDGALAHRLLSPARHVDKTYYALVDGQVTEEDVKKIAAGVDIGDERPTLPAALEILSVKRKPLPEEKVTPEKALAKAASREEALYEKQEPSEEWQSEIRLTIHEGRYHQVKRMMAALGKEVRYLKRLSMGPLVLPEDLKKGEWRSLTPEETEKLMNSCYYSQPIQD